jgi:hypothetical protein
MAEEAAVKIRQGIDPRNGRAALKNTVPGVLTVAQAVQLFLDGVEKKKAWKRTDSRSNWFNPISYHALPIIGHLPVEGVHVEHVNAILDACTEKKLRATGSKIRSKLSTVFNWLRAQTRYRALPNPFDASLINANPLYFTCATANSGSRSRKSVTTSTPLTISAPAPAGDVRSLDVR